MKRRNLIVIAFTFIACLMASISADAQLLWKIEKPGMGKVSYLLGTHHMAPVSMLDSIKGLKEGLGSVEKLYGEIDMSAMRDASAMLGMQSKLLAPADSTLDKICTPAELDTIKVAWDKATKGIAPLSAMYPLKPALISTQLVTMFTSEIFPQADPTAPGIDETMQLLAREAGKEVEGLETMDFQFNLLFNKPILKQKEGLLETVRDGGEKIKTQTKEISDAYIAHDINRIEQIAFDPDSMEIGESEELILLRNDNWVKKLREELPGQSVMVVVGAAHLPGKRGVINGLREAGFTVTPID